MVKKFLKIAGVKSEAEFYKKFPSEKAFFKAHPEAKDLKKYKQGGELKKLNQLTSFEGDMDGLIPIAQDGWVERAANAEFSCKANPRGNLRKACEERYNIGGLSKEEKRALKSELEASNLKGLVNYDDYYTLKNIAEAHNSKMGRADKAYSKMFDPTTGELLPTATGMGNEPELRATNRWYKGRTNLSPFDVYQGIFKDYNVTGAQSPKQASEFFNKAYEAGYAMPKAQTAEKQAYGGTTSLVNPGGIGSYTGGPTYEGFNPISFGAVYNPQEYMHLGSTQAMRDEQAYRQAMMNQQASQQSGGSGGGMGDISKMLKGIMGSQGSTGGIDQTSTLFSGGGDEAGALTNLASGMAKRGKKVKKAQGGVDEPICGPGFKYDPISKDCLPDFSIAIPNKQNSAASPGQVGDYEEVPKFQVNPNLSTGTPQTGPGTGVNPAQAPKTGGYDFFDKVSKAAGLSGKIYQGFRSLQAEKEQRRQAEQQASVSDLTLQATMSKPEQQFRKYVRPEDYLIQPEQLFPTYGVGTNVLTAENGMQVGGNLGEIQNTYAPNNLYDDLGYEPLPHSDVIKQYQSGGGIPWGQLGGFGSQIGMAATGNDAGGQIGSDIGGAAGEAIGNAILPGIGGQAGKAIGSTAGAIGGGLLDRNPQRIRRAQERAKKNAMTAAFMSGAEAMRAPISAHVKNGGWVSHDWQPQVITQFGEHSMHDLLRPDPMMDTLRTGGHITQNNMYPQDQYALGGSLKTTWGGYAEPISNNPNDESETVMFRGLNKNVGAHSQSAGNGQTGIGVKYGDTQHDSYTDYAEYGTEQADADVEVEKGEPAIEMTDPQTGEKNMVVFGNLRIPKSLLDEIGDPSAKGKKFKGYVAHLAKMENKQNKILSKSSQQLDSLEVLTPYDKLKFDALQASVIGATAKLKDYSNFKTNAAAVQSALNDTADEYGVDADHLAKGKIKIDKSSNMQAKWGKKIEKAQNGYYSAQPGFVGPQPPVDYLESLFQQADKATGKQKKELTTHFQEAFHTYFPSVAKDIILSDKEVTAKGKKMGYKTMDQLKKASDKDILETNVDGAFERRTRQYHGLLGGFKPSPYVPGTQLKVKPQEKPEQKSVDTVESIKRNKWLNLAGQLVPYFRPSDTDYDVDLTPEMMALSMNALEPTEAQLYSPQLLTPYDISYQDQLNEITAQSRAAERMAGQNPAAAAAILGQASQAKSRVLGEQFRQNQAQRMGVYNQNIATLNDAKLKNLAILEDQAKKQAMARSNTKAQAMAAANSIADKIAKNKLENRTLQVYENLYNYRYTPDFRAVNMNAPYQFDYTVGGKSGATGGLASGYEFTYDASGNIIGTRKKKADSDARNGRLVRAMKHI